MSPQKNKRESSKQRTPRQLKSQKDISVYLAQSKDALETSFVLESSGSEESELVKDYQKKRKERSQDPLERKISKIRKTFGDNVSFPDEKNEFEGVLSEFETSTKNDNSSSDMKSFTKAESTLPTNVEDKLKIWDTQDTLEGLDDLFEEEWTFKKNEIETLDDLFQDDWSYNDIDFSTPKRCLIIDIIWDKSCMTLTVKDVCSGVLTTIECCGIWCYTNIEPGEFIVVKAKNVSTNKWTVDNNFGWIINQPDTLISGTSVVGALFCTRRSIFMEKFRQIENLPYNSVGNKFMLTGSLTHELFQTILSKDIRDIKKMNVLLDDILKSKHAIEMMYSAGVSVADCKDLMKPSVPQIYKFIQRYILGNAPEASDENFCGKIEKIHDIEENVWIPSLGLKGKIDLTVEISSKLKDGSSATRKVVPLELKTGRSSFSSEHQGQLILYTMMMTMTGRKIDSGLLLYIGENIMKEIVGSYNAQRDLITLRNTVAYYSTRQPTIIKVKDEDTVSPMQFPPPINHQTCSKCPYNILCCTYLTENDKKEMNESHVLKNMSGSITHHLSPEHIEYVQKWISLMQIEETADNEDAFSWKDVWTMKPARREKRGSCVSNLNIVSVSEHRGRFIHQFQRFENKEQLLDINTNDFSVSEYVIISTDSRINIGSGFVHKISSSFIAVSCDKDIKKVYKDLVFHIDKSSSTSLLTHNLGQLGGLLDDNEICSKLRKIVIERKPTTFETELPPSIMEIGEDIFNRLNANQKEAILKVLTTDDYLLIKGFPGTGKTQTLVAMIQLFLKLDKSVLVTAHTNTAVDNILLKLLDLNIDFVRLGSSAKVHPSLELKMDDILTADCHSPEDLHSIYCSKKVVGVTCYGTNHVHLSKRRFDICIVDESTQVLQPTIVRPLYCASKFVLVGDPEQLPPIAKNNTARKLGLTESLFARLDSPNNSIALTQQYRMNSCIMEIANKLTYLGQLQVGNETIGNATLPVTNIKEFESCEGWVRSALSLRLKNSAIFLNTSATYKLTVDPSLKEAKGASNYWEAAIIKRLVKALKNLGIESKNIGIITPYRAQVRLLQKLFFDDVEVNTVDQYQGRDKSVIIYSCAKSVSPDINIQEFDILEDHQRLTVAVTRAKHKLIIVGDLYTLNRFTPFIKLIETLGKERIYDLKDGEDDFYFKQLMGLLI